MGFLELNLGLLGLKCEIFVLLDCPDAEPLLYPGTSERTRAFGTFPGNYVAPV